MAEEKKEGRWKDVLLYAVIGYIVMSLLNSGGNNGAGTGSYDPERDQEAQLRTDQRAFEQQQRHDLDVFNGTVNGQQVNPPPPSF